MSERVVIVTGAASGIGRAVALMLGARGFAVVAVDIDADGAHNTADAIADAVALGADVAERATGGRLVEAALERWGRLDALVTVAGMSIATSLADMTDEDFDRVLGVNLVGTFRCSRAAIPALRETRGAVVTFGSVIGRGSMAEQGAYGAAKAGIESLTRTLALEHARDGVRFNCVLPGSTDTAMLWQGLAPAEVPAARAIVEDEVPLGRVAGPDEIAEVVAFLVSPAASFVTGTSLIADGGTLAKLASTY